MNNRQFRLTLQEECKLTVNSHSSLSEALAKATMQRKEHFFQSDASLPGIPGTTPSDSARECKEGAKHYY